MINWYLSDRLSERLVLDGSGNVIGRMAHLPFGEDFGESGTQEKHHFTTYERDGESGTDYAVNRQYSQIVGRFNRPDPLEGSSRRQLNRFAYADNDSIDRIDPNGLSPYSADDSFDDSSQAPDLSSDAVEPEKENKGLKFCKSHIAALESDLAQGITAGELISQRSAELGGIFRADAQNFEAYVSYFFNQIPLTPGQRFNAGDIFYSFGYNWAALSYNAYNKEYARIYAKIGRKHLEGLAEASRKITNQCWGYPALRGRLTDLVNNTEFTESTYLAFFYGMLAAIAGA